VDWFNAVDATYRADLRELNELNFTRFDAKLEQRLAELRSELVTGIARLEANLEPRFAALEARSALLDESLKGSLSAFEARVERRLGEQTRWLLAAWGALLAGVIGLWFRS
jgi:hypothetical protein